MFCYCFFEVYCFSSGAPKITLVNQLANFERLEKRSYIRVFLYVGMASIHLVSWDFQTEFVIHILSRFVAFIVVLETRDFD
jgi:hypothetical protein